MVDRRKVTLLFMGILLAPLALLLLAYEDIRENSFERDDALTAASLSACINAVITLAPMLISVVIALYYDPVRQFVQVSFPITVVWVLVTDVPVWVVFRKCHSNYRYR